ncbi:hypothetical protein DAEQUDRAFT_149505 [Daedalea quercina L-15889]|uniref:Uncharacterized protein n=1 Tax=Daedalea quercina L-15889 TaxID=1314783 RepID=A0A165KM71_9APHY|nr:hypothetical protein DAEQUDRAFT_149505 [Daedalea quercina L-15889]
MQRGCEAGRTPRQMSRVDEEKAARGTRVHDPLWRRENQPKRARERAKASLMRRASLPDWRPGWTVAEAWNACRLSHQALQRGGVSGVEAAASGRPRPTHSVSAEKRTAETGKGLDKAGGEPYMGGPCGGWQGRLFIRAPRPLSRSGRRPSESEAALPTDDLATFSLASLCETTQRDNGPLCQAEPPGRPAQRPAISRVVATDVIPSRVLSLVQIRVLWPPHSPRHRLFTLDDDHSDRSA